MPIIARELPTPPSITEFDQSVLDALTGPSSPQQIAAAIGARTHRVAVRLKALTDRGLAKREKVVGGPANGPGSVRYLPAG